MGSSRGKYLLKNTAIFALGNFGTKFISFFLVPLYTNKLTTSQYGIVDMVSTLSMLLVPLLTFNICESVMRFSLDDDADQNKVMSTGICSLVIMMLSGLLIIPIAGAVEGLSDYAVYLYLYSASLAFSQMFLCYLRGKELLLRYSIGNIIQTLCIAIFNVCFLVALDKGIKGYLTAYIIANFITAVYAFVAGDVFDVLRNFSVDRTLSKHMVTYAVVLIPNSFMWWIMNSSDRLMVTAMVGAAANGVYAIAYKVPTLLSTVTQVFNQAWSYSAIRETGSSDAEEYNNVVYDRLVATVCICASGLMMVMKVFLRYYVGAEYYEAWRYTPVLIMGFVFSTLGTFAATSYTVHKDSMGYLASGVAGAIINVTLNLLLIPVFGAMGAAIATAFSYFVVFVFRVQNTKKYLKLHVLQKRHMVGYLLLVVQAFTMFVEKGSGQILLTVEFAVILLVFKDCLVQIMMIMKRLVLKSKMKRAE